MAAKKRSNKKQRGTLVSTGSGFKRVDRPNKNKKPKWTFQKVFFLVAIVTAILALIITFNQD